MSTTPGPVRAAVVGLPGYGAVELVRILASHPAAEIVGAFGSPSRFGGASRAMPIGELVPKLRGLADVEVRAAAVDSILAVGADVVLTATPNEASHELVPPLVDAGTPVIDLSGSFRLKDAGLYPHFYGFEHTRPDLLDEAAYGMPELSREGIGGARLIAAPGCYPTATVLALAPLLAAGAVTGTPIVDAVSGVSGAGRGAGVRAHLSELSVQPYGVFGHRHGPEITQALGAPVVFTPHLAAFDRGIVATIHITAVDSASVIGDALAQAYRDEPFVRLRPPGEWPAAHEVAQTNFCDIAWAMDDATGHVIIVSAIDNLVKGAAGQAVQCINIRFGMPETAGLGLEGLHEGAGVMA